MALIDNRLITAFQMITYVSLFNLKIHEKGTCKTKEDGDDSRVLHAGQEKKRAPLNSQMMWRKKENCLMPCSYSPISFYPYIYDKRFIKW